MTQNSVVALSDLKMQSHLKYSNLKTSIASSLVAVEPYIWKKLDQTSKHVDDLSLWSIQCTFWVTKVDIW